MTETETEPLSSARERDPGFETSRLLRRIDMLESQVFCAEQSQVDLRSRLSTTISAWMASQSTKEALVDLYSAAVDEPKSREDLLTQLRLFLAGLSDSERVEFFAAVDEGYCPSCGRKLRGRDDFCPCENDE